MGFDERCEASREVALDPRPTMLGLLVCMRRPMSAAEQAFEWACTTEAAHRIAVA